MLQALGPPRKLCVCGLHASPQRTLRFFKNTEPFNRTAKPGSTASPEAQHSMPSRTGMKSRRRIGVCLVNLHTVQLRALSGTATPHLVSTPSTPHHTSPSHSYLTNGTYSILASTDIPQLSACASVEINLIRFYLQPHHPGDLRAAFVLQLEIMLEAEWRGQFFIRSRRRRHTGWPLCLPAWTHCRLRFLQVSNLIFDPSTFHERRDTSSR